MNEEAMPLLDVINSKTMASHLRRVYIHSQENIKLQFLSEQDYVCFTQDAWTAPNVTAFMAVTAHFVNEKFQMIDLTLANPNVQGLYSLGFLKSPYLSCPYKANFSSPLL